MTTSSDDTALRYLAARFDFYERLILERLLEVEPEGPDLTELAKAIRSLEASITEQGGVLPIAYLRDRAGISGIAEDILLLAASIELDPRIGALIASYYGSSSEGYVSIGLCQQLFGGNRTARLTIARLLRPGSLLLDSGLVEVVPRDGPRRGRTGYQLVPAPYLPPFLLGDAVDPEALHDVAETIEPAIRLDDVAIDERLRERLIRLVSVPPLSPEAALGRQGPGGYDVAPGMPILLTGVPGSGRRLLVTALAGEMGRRLIRVSSDRLALGTSGGVVKRLELLVEYAWFTNRWLLFEDCDRLFGSSPERQDPRYAPALASLLNRVAITTFMTAQAADSIAESIRQLLYGCLEVSPPERKRLQTICDLNLPRGVALAEDVSFEKLVEKRVLSGITIRNAVAVAVRDSARPDEQGATRPLTPRPLTPRPLTMNSLEWATAGLESASLGTLATRAYQNRRLTDLILPKEAKEAVEAIISTVEVRRRVHSEWGFDRLSSRGLGLSCMFHGDSGTGKTLAAEVIANEVGLPLYQVNMAAVVSKYIGETSKNLSRVFDEAGKSRCVLLFDEADAMFSKRTDVKKSTDRYSNMEINLLLQLMEQYDGITVCTTNLKKGIDQAFERRFSFVIHFPPPETELRLAIWGHHLPPDAPVATDLDDVLEEIAETFELSGGSIRSAVLRAAYQSAIDGTPIGAKQLRDSARQEYRALGKLVRDDQDDW